MLAAQPVRFSKCCIRRDITTNHNRAAKDCRSRVLLESKLGHKVSAHRSILSELLLEPLRIFLEVSQQSIVGSHKQRCDIDHKLAEGDTTATLVRSAHENDTVSRKLN